MIIDYHSHYLAREHFNMHARTPEGRIIGARTSGEGADASLEANGNPLGSACNPADFYHLAVRLKRMEQSGVNMQVLSPPPFMCFTEIPGTEAAKLLREQNEAIAAVVQQYPTSFRGIGAAPVQDAESAVAEIAYLMDTLKLEGIELLTHIGGSNLDSPKLDQVWQALDARQALVFLHPNSVLGVERLSRYYLLNLLGNPVETALALASLMFGNVLERFPHIRFLAAHGGGVAPFLIGRWEHAARVRPELAHLTTSPLDLLRHVYVDTIVHGAPELLYLIRMLGAEHIVLGSDFPFDMGVQDPAALFGTNLSEDVRQQILVGSPNLLRHNESKQGR
ncbi:MAG: amidohydrolase family protein [Ktedonobacteraceae bacterium]